MILYTPSGRLTIDGIMLLDGTFILPGTRLTTDGEFLFEFIDHTIPIYALESNLQSKAVIGSLISYTIRLSCTNNADPGKALTVSVPIPAGFDLVNAETLEGTYNPTTGKWVVHLDNQEANLNLLLEPLVVGEQSQTVTLDGTITEITKTCEIIVSDTGSIVSHDTPLADYPYTVANLQDGKLYTVISYSKVTESEVTGIHEGVRNNRLSVVNGVEIFGSRATIQNNIQKLISTFIYDSTNPVIIRRYDQYQSVSILTNDEWLGLCINEGYNTVYTESTNLLSDPAALFDDTGSSELILPGNSESAEYVYEIAAAATLANQFFTGILLGLNSFGMTPSGIQVQIKTDEKESEKKSTFVSGTGSISFGDMADMWGLIEGDIQNETLYVHIILRNTILNEQLFRYGNLRMALYYVNDETGGTHSIIYNGLHGRVHGFSIDNDNNPAGPQFGLETLKLAMMDGELPIRFNIESKELQVDFIVSGNTLEEAQVKLQSISNWLSNDRNIMSRPVLNSLIFTYDLTREYFVVFKDVIEVEKNITSLLCTAKFLVPEGVARSTEPIVTGPVGTNPGKIRVWPVIEVKTDGSAQLNITDSITGNTITLNNTPPENTTLYIDCEARTILDDSGTDYATNLGLNTIWINFIKEYSITVNGGVLQRVSYYPGF